MAKPGIIPIVWATDNNYSTGPVPLQGTPTKISIPAANLDEGYNGDEIPFAQWDNFFKNHISQWTNWVALASPAAGLDDHLVQTDVNGRFAVAAVEFGSTASASIPVDIQAFNSGATARAINVEVADGSAFNATNSSATATLRVENFGSGQAAQIITTGTGDAAQVIGNDAKAIDATCLLIGAEAVIAVSRFGAGALRRGLINYEPTTVDPSGPLLGDVWFHAGTDVDTGFGAPVWYDGTKIRRAWGTPAGFGRLKADTLSTVDEAAGNFVTAVSTNLGSSDEPAGDYDVVFSGAVSAQVGALGFSGEVQFSVGGVVQLVERVDFITLGTKTTFYFARTVTFAGGGTLQLDIQFKTLTVGKTVRMEESRIRALGTF